MNTFKRKTWAAAAIAALMIAGCAGDKEFLKAQADAAVASGNARVAEANAAAEEARAAIAFAGKVDSGGAAAYLVTKELRKAIGQGSGVQQARIERPRDWLDYLQGVTSVVTALGNAYTPFGLARENGKTMRASYDRDVAVEGQRQTGETARIQSVSSIASQVASSQPQANVTTTNTFSGTGVWGSGTYTGPVTTNRNCNGGAGAAGGGGTTGSAGAGGSAPGGNC